MMNFKNTTKFIVLGLFMFSGYAEAQTTNTKPNILMIVADDLGYADVGFNRGADFPADRGIIPTPNLDLLASNGAICTSAHVAHPFCGPSRAALMTGRYPHAIGAQYNLPNDTETPFGIAESETFMSKVLQDANYNTSMIGKWHLGNKDVYKPLQRGFDSFFGMLGGGHPYFESSYEENYWSRVDRNKIRAADNQLPLPTNEYQVPLDRGNGHVTREEFDEDEYLTDILTEEALIRLKEGVNDYKSDNENPYFMYLAYNAPHTPLEASDAEIAAFKANNPNFESAIRNSDYIKNATPLSRKVLIREINTAQKRLDPTFDFDALTTTEQDNLVDAQYTAKFEKVIKARITYGTMVANMDTNIGKIITELKKDTDVYNNTLIIFFSDNGGKIFTSGGDNHPLTQGKGSVLEGGHRVPMFFHWPNKITSKVYEHNVSTLDMYPTFLDLAGATLPTGKIVDGKSIMNNIVAGTSARPTESLFVLRHQGGFNNVSIKKGTYKIVRISKSDWALYNHNIDPGELTDIRATEPNAAAIITSMVEEASDFYQDFSSIPPGWFDHYRSNNNQIGYWQDGSFPGYDCTFVNGRIPDNCIIDQAGTSIYFGPSAGEDPNTFDFGSLNTDVIKAGNNGFSTYPNPFTSSFNINLDQSVETVNVEIYSLMGHLVKTYPAMNLTDRINANDLSSGTYVLKVIANDQVIVEKIIKN